MNRGFVYILTNDRKTVLYVGCTSNFKSRVYLHLNRFVAGFTKKYNLTRLVHYEVLPSMKDARSLERALKDGSRKRKAALITSANPAWKDLYDQISDSSLNVER